MINKLEIKLLENRKTDKDLFVGTVTMNIHTTVHFRFLFFKFTLKTNINEAK